MKSRKGRHRAHTVQAIKATERDYRGLFAGLPLGVYRSTPDGQIVDANPAFVRMLGYASRKAVLALHAEELYLDLKDRRRWQSMRKSHSVVRDFEVRLRRRDGSAIWVKETTRSVCDAEGCARYYQGVVEDITERKQEEAALRASEEKFRRLAETTSAAMFIYQGTRIRYVNRMSVEMTGYGREELLELDFWKLIHPDCRDLVLERSQARQWGEEVPSRYETKIVTKNGQARWVDFTAAAIEMDGDPAVLGTAYDITERKRVEEQLRFSAEILEKGNTLIFVADSQGEIIYVSPYVKTVLGYEPHELLGDGWWEITWGDPAEREREKHRIACCARGEIPVREASYEREVRTRDGESRCLLWQDSQGPDSLLIGVAQDLTERKRLEAQLLYLAAHDPLTGLANRRRLEEELERQLALAQRYHTQGAFLWLDLDQFKDINDTLGHHAGDELLGALSDLLRERLREVDFLARLGGDEFALILVHTDGEQAQKVAREILGRLRHHSFTIQGQPVSVTASIGIALFPQHGAKADGNSHPCRCGPIPRERGGAQPLYLLYNPPGMASSDGVQGRLGKPHPEGISGESLSALLSTHPRPPEQPGFPIRIVVTPEE